MMRRKSWLSRTGAQTHLSACAPEAQKDAICSPSEPVSSVGGEIGSTRVVKIKFLPGMIPPLSGHFTNANDNVDMSEVAVAA